MSIQPLFSPTSPPARRLAAPAAGLFLLSAMAQGQVVRVNASAAPGGDGKSWATAFDDLMDGLATAAADPAVQEVWVAAGTYTPAPPSGDRTRTFALVNGVAVLGGFAGTETLAEQRDPVANPTILSGDLNGNDNPTCDTDADGFPDFCGAGENSKHVVTAFGVDASAVLDGFTVRGGHADDVPLDPYFRQGAGILVVDASPTLRDLNVLYNHAPPPGEGGGLYFEGAGALVATGCRFDTNAALDGGAARILADSIVLFEDCSFVANFATAGGGLSIEGSAVVGLVESVFAENHATGGGAVRAIISASVTVLDCTFQGNTGTGGPALLFHGSPDVLVAGSTFQDNAGTEGGGISFQPDTAGPSSLQVSDSSFTGNRATAGGGASIRAADQAQLTGVHIERSTFESNWATAGAGIFVIGPVPPVGGFPVEVAHCRFERNHVLPEAGIGKGGEGITVVWDQAPVDVHDSLFVDNELGHLRTDGTSTTPGSEPGGEIRATRCTFANTGIGDVGIDAYQGTIDLQDCIVWGQNPFPIKDGVHAVVTVAFSDVKGGFAGSGNLNLDPLFVDPAAGDFRLQPGSPCIDQGSPGPITGADLDGDPRSLDGNLDASLATDMGADEFNAIHLELGALVPGGTVTITTTGAPGLVTLMGLGTTPGQVFVPGFGTVFLDLASPVSAFPWAGTPSSVTVPVPPGSSPGDTWILQEAAVLPGGGATLSNAAIAIVQ